MGGRNPRISSLTGFQSKETFTHCQLMGQVSDRVVSSGPTQLTCAPLMNMIHSLVSLSLPDEEPEELDDGMT